MLTKRQLKLVDILKNANDYQSVKKIANRLGVSERTLHSELKIIENQGIKLNKKRGYGVKLIIFNQKYNEFSKIEVDTVLKRRIDIMKRLIFKKEKITFLSLSEEYFTSTTSIQNDLQVIASVLFQGTNIKFMSDYLGTRLSPCNTEELIKIMVNFNSFIISETTSGLLEENNEIEKLSEYYSSEIIHVCKNILYSFVKENVDTISETYVESFLRHLIVLVYQLKNNNHIVQNHKPIDYYKHAFYIDSAVKILHKASLRLSFDYCNNDVQYLSLLLLNYKFEQIPHDAIEKEIIYNLIKHVSQAMNINFMQDKLLFEQLEKHIPAMLSRLKHHTIVKNPFTDQIKLEYLITYNTIWMVAESLIQNDIIKINAEEIAFLTLYFQLSIEKIGRGRKILIICPTGIVTSELLINRIKTLSPSFDTVEIASISEALELNLELYDLVLSTVKLEKKIKNVYFVSPLISNEKLKELFSKNKTYKKYELTQNILKKYINDELIFLDKTINSKKELFEKISLILNEKGYVNQTFVKSLFEREALGGTDLPIGVSIPHGKASDVKKTFVSIVKLEKKIHWQDYKVNVVIIIGIAKKDIELTKKIISNIYNIINHNEVLSELRKATTNEEVKKIIYGEE